MRPSFQTTMVNGPFEDAVLYVDMLFERRALLFDAGNLRALSAKKLMRVSDLFVSHAHMDHFSDFDWLLRLRVGRSRPLRLYGPEGFIERMRHKLSAYTWNLVQNYDDDLVVTVTELAADGGALRAVFHCREGFRFGGADAVETGGGVLLEDTGFRVRAAVFDHSIPVLGFCVEEAQHVNVWKNRLDELGLPVGPWLRELKRAVLARQPDDTRIEVESKGPGESGRAGFALGYLKEQVLQIVPGQKIGYLVDVAFTDENCRQAVGLYHGCDLLFIEAAFLDEDATTAGQRNHLTARQAGEIAARVGAGRVVPIHFSPRYSDRESALRDEVESEFRRSVVAR